MGLDQRALGNSQNYYGKVLGSSADLRTDACSAAAAPSPTVTAALARVHAKVKARHYGCGFVAPDALEGARILDLGCGAGQDVYLLAQLVGENGAVVGVDATPEQLAVARGHESWHAEQFGYAKSNVRFIEGDITKLGGLDLAPKSFDVIVSNCVINLVDDKPAVFRAAKTLLKPGGELYFADVYVDRRLPQALRHEPVLHGECLAGALYWNDFLRLAKAAGFLDPRLVTSRPIAVSDPDIRAALGAAKFFSATYRLFSLDDLECACEDYGQAVRYKGGLPGAEHVFKLDAHHDIEAGRLFPVCGNTLRMLRDTRFSTWFDYYGDESSHFGIFKGCGTTIPFAQQNSEASVSSGCC